MSRKTPVRLSPTQRQAVCARYLETRSENKVAAEFGVHQGTIHNILKAAGIARRKYRRMTAEKREMLLAAWQAGDSIESIMEQFDVTSDYAYTMAREHLGAALGFRSLRTYTLNEAAFDILAPDAAYWAGFLMADGNVSRPRFSYGARYVTLALAERDAAHIDLFRAFLGTDQPVVVRNNRRNGNNAQPLHYLSVYSRRLADRLESLGLIPAKGKGTTVTACLEDDRDFWRGMVDGDGWVSIPKSSGVPHLGLAGSHPLLSQYVAFIARRIGSTRKVAKVGNSWAVTLTGSKAEAIAALLYDGATVALPRKAAAAELFKERRRLMDAK